MNGQKVGDRMLRAIVPDDRVEFYMLDSVASQPEGIAGIEIKEITDQQELRVWNKVLRDDSLRLVDVRALRQPVPTGQGTAKMRSVLLRVYLLTAAGRARLTALRLVHDG